MGSDSQLTLLDQQCTLGPLGAPVSSPGYRRGERKHPSVCFASRIPKVRGEVTSFDCAVKGQPSVRCEETPIFFSPFGIRRSLWGRLGCDPDHPGSRG